MISGRTSSNLFGKNSLVNSVIHGPIMILEILRIYDQFEKTENGKKLANTEVIKFVNESPRELKNDTKTVLKMRGFSEKEIPKLAGSERFM